MKRRRMERKMWEGQRRVSPAILVNLPEGIPGFAAAREGENQKEIHFVTELGAILENKKTQRCSP